MKLTIVNQYEDRVNVRVERPAGLPTLFSRTRSSRPRWSVVNADGRTVPVESREEVAVLEARYQRALCPVENKS